MIIKFFNMAALPRALTEDVDRLTMLIVSNGVRNSGLIASILLCEIAKSKYGLDGTVVSGFYVNEDKAVAHYWYQTGVVAIDVGSFSESMQCEIERKFRNKGRPAKSIATCFTRIDLHKIDLLHGMAELYQLYCDQGFDKIKKILFKGECGQFWNGVYTQIKGL